MTLEPIGDDDPVPYRYRSSDRVLALLGIHGPMTVAGLAEHLTQSPAQVRRQLQRLRKRGHVERIGSGRISLWQVIRDPNSPTGRHNPESVIC